LKYLLSLGRGSDDVELNIHIWLQRQEVGHP
jgi:hypothetical protein